MKERKRKKRASSRRGEDMSQCLEGGLAAGQSESIDEEEGAFFFRRAGSQSAAVR
jgi:hypothetical protein